MAQNRAGPAGQHRRPPPPPLGELAVPDRVDTAVDDVEVAGLDAPLDLVTRISEGSKLPILDDSVLAIRQLGDRSIT
jgi:hypothetical protein